MSCYIIPIGGTGERVMRAIIHLTAAGIFDKFPQDMKILGIDPDAISCAKTILTDTIADYNELHREGIFGVRVEDNSIWSPMGDLHTSLQNDIGNTTSENELFDFMYSKRERMLDLSGGFYSHTSIGSYYILDRIVDSNGKFVEPWKSFFSNIKPSDKIIIICSMFGGTGASGVPTVARELRRHNIAGEDTSGANITGIFLEPYFTSETADTVNTSAFPTKSKIAFEYYDQQGFGKDIFDSMYFLGESEEMMKVKHHESGEKQRNKANVIELYAATAVLNEVMLKKNHVPGQCDVMISQRGTDKTDKIFSRKALQIRNANGENVNIFKRMAYFMAFCVIYTKVLFPLINEKSKAKFLKKYKLLEKVDGNTLPIKSAVTLRAYCEKYMEWMREIITESKGFEDFTPQDLNDPNALDFPYTSWFMRKPYTLYNGWKAMVTEPLDVANIPTFETMIRSTADGENNLPSSQTIYSALCDKGLFEKSDHTLSELVRDTLTYMRTL